MPCFQFELHGIDFSSDFRFDFSKVHSLIKIRPKILSSGLFQGFFAVFLRIPFEDCEFGNDASQLREGGVSGKEEWGVVPNRDVAEGIDLPPLFIEEGGVAGGHR